MRECGEDLLVDISDVLYNELAFFRLMQNLDNGNVEVAEPQMQVRKVIIFCQCFYLSCGELHCDLFEN